VQREVGERTLGSVRRDYRQIRSRRVGDGERKIEAAVTAAPAVLEADVLALRASHRQGIY
jgi:hypothetical protein